MLEYLSAEQWEEWCEYASIEPWGFPADDLRTGILGATVARGAGAKDAEPKHFMLRNPEEQAEDADPFDSFSSMFKPTQG